MFLEEVAKGLRNVLQNYPGFFGLGYKYLARSKEE